MISDDFNELISAIIYDKKDSLSLLVPAIYSVHEELPDTTEMKFQETILHECASLGSTNCFIYLIENGADPNLKTINRITPLMIASQNNRLEIISYLLQLEIVDVNEQSARGLTALHYAIQCIQVKAIKLLVDSRKYEINQLVPNIFHMAISTKSRKVINLLLKRNANPNVQYEDGSYPIHHLLDLNFPIFLVALFLENYDKWDFKIKDKDQNTLLHYVANIRDINNFSVIFAMLEKKHKEIKYEVNIKKQSYAHVAALKNNRDIFDLILGKPSDYFNINQQDNDGNTVLHIFAMNQEIRFVEIILENRTADVTLKNNEGLTPLDIIFTLGNEMIYKTLVSIDVENITSLPRKSFFYWAALNGREKLFSRMKSIPFDFNQEDDSHMTVLMYSLVKNNLNTTRIILRSRLVDPNFQNYQKSSAIYLAVANGLVECVRLLMLYPTIDVNLIGNRHETPIFAAINGEYYDIVKLFLEDPRTDLEFENVDGETPFLAACRRGNKKIILEFFDHRVDVFKLNNQGENACFLAVYSQVWKALDLLMDFGIYDAQFQANNGDNLLDHALSYSEDWNMIETIFTHYRSSIELSKEISEHDKTTALDNLSKLYEESKEYFKMYNEIANNEVY